MPPSHRTTNPHRAEQGLRNTLLGIVANLVLVIIKGGAGILGNSFALVADAIESTADVFTSLIVWFGLKKAIKEPDEDHPYGHGKAEPLAAMVVAISLAGAAIFIAVQSVRHILTPHAVPEPYTLIVLLVIVVVKELLYRRTIRISKEAGSTAVKADAWHHRADALTSSTAMVGIGVALIGGPAYASADDWAALIAAGIIVFNSYHIFWPSFTEIMDAAPPSEIAQEIAASALSVPGVLDTDHCLVRKMGFEYFVDLHITVNGNLTVRQGHELAHLVKQQIMEDKPYVYDVLVHVEPDDLLNPNPETRT